MTKQQQRIRVSTYGEKRLQQSKRRLRKSIPQVTNASIGINRTFIDFCFVERFRLRTQKTLLLFRQTKRKEFSDQNSHASRTADDLNNTNMNAKTKPKPKKKIKIRNETYFGAVGARVAATNDKLFDAIAMIVLIESH